MITRTYRGYVGLLGLSGLSTATGVGVAYLIEHVLLPKAPTSTQEILVGLIEEAFVRLLPLVVTFYIWSFLRGQLLSKAEGFGAAVLSGVVVAALEVVFKLRYLAQFEGAARFDALILPILLVHLPFALLAGRLAYEIGDRVHGPDTIRVPSFSRRTAALLLGGYLLFARGHVLYNVLV